MTKKGNSEKNESINVRKQSKEYRKSEILKDHKR